MSKVKKVVPAVEVEPTTPVVEANESVEIPMEFINFLVQHRQCSIEEANGLINKLINKSESKPNANRGKFTRLTDSNNPHFAHWLNKGKVKYKDELYRLVSAHFYEGYPTTTLYLKLRNENNTINCISYKSCELIPDAVQLEMGI